MKCIAPYSENEIIDRPVKLEPRVRDVKSKQSKQQPVIAPVRINYDHNNAFRNIREKILSMDVSGCESTIEKDINACSKMRLLLFSKTADAIQFLI